MIHLLVMVDKFTKWIEVKPIKKLNGKTAVKFLEDIINRYGYPHSIITDNGSNFAKGAFQQFCGAKGIRLMFPPSRTRNPMAKQNEPLVSC